MSTPNRIRLCGHVDVPEERLAAVTVALPEHIRLTRAEPGCIAFEVTADPRVPGRFNVAELFADRAAFDAHQARMKGSDWGRITAGLPRSYEISEETP